MHKARWPQASAPYASDKVRIKGIGHVRLQECDRLHAMAEELSKRGILCAEEKSAITIFPGSIRPGVVETYDDHRVAMAFSLLGLRTAGIVINHPDCCKKTFEEYFDILDCLLRKTMEANPLLVQRDSDFASQNKED